MKTSQLCAMGEYRDIIEDFYPGRNPTLIEPFFGKTAYLMRILLKISPKRIKLISPLFVKMYEFLVKSSQFFYGNQNLSSSFPQIFVFR
jgi:hypothetical protein